MKASTPEKHAQSVWLEVMHLDNSGAYFDPIVNNSSVHDIQEDKMFFFLIFQSVITCSSSEMIFLFVTSHFLFFNLFPPATWPQLGV